MAKDKKKLKEIIVRLTTQLQKRNEEIEKLKQCRFCNEGNLPWWDEFWIHTIEGSNIDCNGNYPEPLNPEEAKELNEQRR